MLYIEKFAVNPFQENTYVVYDETRQGVVIDCGVFFDAERKKLVDSIREKDITIIHSLATHGHIDHNFGNNTLADAFGVRPKVFYADEILMNGLSMQAKEFCGYDMDYDMPHVEKYLTTEDTVSFGAHTFSILHTPGHTPGSVFYYCKEENVAFSGDTLFQMSVGRTDLKMGSYADLMKSLSYIVKSLPEDTVILPGHGPQTTIRNEKQMNPFLTVV